MKHEEFKNLKVIEDKNNPFSVLYETRFGERFYIEPVFYTMLRGFKDHHPDKYEMIVSGIYEAVHMNRKVIFTGNYECPLTHVDDDDYVYLEITDITDPLQIFVEDKSRGSDYGD